MNINDKIVKTSQGYSAIWEEGGAKTTTSEVIIITGSNGEKLKPIYIRKKGQRACGQHALFILKQGMYAIRLNSKEDFFNINIYKYEGKEFELFHYSNNIENILPVCLSKAVEIALEKSRHYHCKIPYYLIEEEVVCK